MTYMGRFLPKGVPFSGFRCGSVGISLKLKYMKEKRKSVILVSKKYLKGGQMHSVAVKRSGLWFILILYKKTFMEVKGDTKF